MEILAAQLIRLSSYDLLAILVGIVVIIVVLFLGIVHLIWLHRHFFSPLKDILLDKQSRIRVENKARRPVKEKEKHRLT